MAATVAGLVKDGSAAAGRPVTVEVGCNEVVGTDPARILSAFRRVMDAEAFTCGTPEKWDGLAAERIADVLVTALAGTG
jgi:UDP-N-acetylglucosamine 2-epimerase (non-hydrolysing)